MRETKAALFRKKIGSFPLAPNERGAVALYKNSQYYRDLAPALHKEPLPGTLLSVLSRVPAAFSRSFSSVEVIMSWVVVRSFALVVRLSRSLVAAVFIVYEPCRSFVPLKVLVSPHRGHSIFL